MTGIGLLNKNNVQIARENYLAAQKALAESEKLLAERVEREAQAKIKFNEVQLELAKLNNENMNMVSCTDNSVSIPEITFFATGRDQNRFEEMYRQSHPLPRAPRQISLFL